MNIFCSLIKAITFLFVYICICNFSFAGNIDTLRILNDLKVIVETKEARNYVNIEILNQVAEFIKTEFAKSSNKIEV